MNASNHNFFLSFANNFEEYVDKPLLVTEHDLSLSYADINQESAKLASFFTKLGVSPGERVSAQVEKSPQALCLYLACLRAGLVFHPLNPAYTPQELVYFLNDAEPAVLICDPVDLDSLSTIANGAKIKHKFTLGADGNGSLIDLSRDASETFKCVNRDADDMAALLYSSGTTGIPKGIMITHMNLASNAQALVDAWGFTHNDKLLHALPIFHVHGLFVAVGCALLSGASMHWLPKFDSDLVVRHLPEATSFMGVPTYYTRLLNNKNFTSKVSENIRLYVSGSAPLLEETFQSFQQRTGHQILERYGMTETNMNSSNPLNGERRAGTVGPPLAGIEIRIMGDDNIPLTQNEIGNLQVRGPNVFKGYWKLPEKTAEDFTQDGFFNTGDKGMIDEMGYVTIVGRSKDVIITGGLNVYPKEVELIIDDIVGVKESAVIGLPHSDLGEAVTAIVVLDGTATITGTKIIEHTKTLLANYKAPKEVVITTELPRNTMGKVQKNVLRDQHSTS